MKFTWCNDTCKSSDTLILEKLWNLCALIPPVLNPDAYLTTCTKLWTGLECILLLTYRTLLRLRKCSRTVNVGSSKSQWGITMPGLGCFPGSLVPFLRAQDGEASFQHPLAQTELTKFQFYASWLILLLEPSNNLLWPPRNYASVVPAQSHHNLAIDCTQPGRSSQGNQHV